MDSHWGTPNHRKRKRRRGDSRPALSAHLFFDSRLKGDVGLLSEDLFSELFPQRAAVDESSNPTCYVAITPQQPPSLFSPHTAPWTILAVRRPSEQHASKQHARSTLHLPASSNGVQGIVSALQRASPHKPLTNLQQGVDIRILDVAPLALESIAVSLDFSALARLEAAQNEYKHSTSGRRGSRPRSRSGSGNGGHGAGLTNGTSTNSADEAVGKWEGTIRDALSGPKILHSGDLIPLPYTSHPITHAPPPPVHVELCEPVAQGLLFVRTKIVVLDSSRSKRTALPIQSPILPNGISEEDEDTSNEQFYSAAEEKTSIPTSRRTAQVRRQQSETEDSEDSTDDDIDLSEDEGDAIGLDLPMIPSHSSGVLSALSSATPRPGQFPGNGVSSPGGASVFSGFSTTSTIRGASAKGRLFETQGLYAHIEDDALHPKPAPEEDEEARVFIDTTSLTKIGCFSGDWVRLEAAPNSSFGAMASWGLSALDPESSNDHEWRVAKIYALPGQPTQRPKYAINRKGDRSSSFALSLFDKPSLKAYLSPLLLANLGSPANVRLSPLAPPPPPPRNFGRGPPPKPRQSATLDPPTAKEVTFLKLLTPLATERNLDTSLFNGIGRFFKSRQRVVKAGDVLGISIDGDLGKAIYQAAPADEDADQGELLENGDPTKAFGGRKVVWFKIGSVSVEPARDDAEQDEEISWGGIAIVDPATTRMAQSGSERGKLPDCLHSSWPYYLGAKRLPSKAEEVVTNESIRSPPRVKVPLLRRRLRELISAAVSPQSIHLGLPPMAILLTSTQRHIGKASVVTAACLDLGLHTFNIDANDIITEGGGGGGDTKTAGLLEARAERGLTCGPEYTALLIQHVEALTAERMVSTLKQILSSSRVFIATTTDTENVPEGVRSLFTHEIEIHAPDEGEREGLLRDIVQNSDVPISADVDLSSVAVKTAALVAGDLVDVVERALVARRDRLEKLASTSNLGVGPSDFRITVRDIQIAGGNSSRCVTKADFNVAVDAARKNFADAIGAPKIPSVGWDDVGGLTNVKDAVMETIQLPLERPELFAKGMKKRSGILFYGPPGTGKTLLAKAIATEFSLNFFSVKGPELLNMYIGESEANVRRVFQRARDARPCVVFFDELDSVAPKRGNQGDSGGVMDRIVSQLLAELDGMSSGEDTGGGVFVIGATNRPDLLDQALLRPGRFDKMLYLGVSDTHEKQQTILEALTRKFALHPSLSLQTIASALPFTYTGADLYALCSDAMLKAITRRADSVDSKVSILNKTRASASPPLPAITVAYFFDHLAGPDDTDVVVDTEDFKNAMKELVPSVSVKELEHYSKVRQVFEKGEEAQIKPHAALDREKGVQKANGKTRAPLSHQGYRDADDDDFVIKTGGLSLSEQTNGLGNWNGNGAIGAPKNPVTGAGAGGKGKGKAHAVPQFDAHDFGFGKATDGDEELYSP